MAAIYRTTGARGEGATDPGIEMPLETVERRLKSYPCAFRGESPPQILPVTQYWTHLVIAISNLDDKTPKFPRNGYYSVIGLQVRDAGFLFQPTPGAASLTGGNGWGSS
jgi:hypothetical protein